MRFAAIAFSERGMALGNRLKDAIPDFSLEHCRQNGLASWAGTAFQQADALVFIGAMGIAVRAIAPFLKSKLSDPAVIVIDELGRHVIPVLSGHVGGANEIADKLADILGTNAVITTATDINHVFAIDTWAKKQGLIIANPENIKVVSSKLLSGGTVKIKSQFPIQGTFPENVTLDDKNYDVLITCDTKGKADALRLIPPILTLGVGCRRDTKIEAMNEAYEMLLKKSSCHPSAIGKTASIDLKKDEPGLIEFCHQRGLPFYTYAAKELAAVEGNFSHSAFVEKITGIGNVCERAAVLCSGGSLISKKDAGNGVTMALAIKMPKLRFEESV